MGRAARVGEEHLREARHPRGRAQVPRRRHRAVRIRSRVPPQPRRPRAAGRDLHRHGHRAARAPRAREGVLRQDHPEERQQVRRAQLRSLEWRQLHLRAAGRERRDAAAGLLPHQRGEHGPVRAHADHRRRGQPGALHRGLLGAGVHHRLAALRGRRDRREAERPRHLHDHPELVEQRLQPRHQARARRDRRPHGVDRRQHRQPPHDEVPGRRDGRAEGVGRGPVGRLRRPRPAPGRRRQDDARRAGDHEQDRVEVDLEGRRAHVVPRPRPHRRRRLRLQEPRAVRRADPRRGLR